MNKFVARIRAGIAAMAASGKFDAQGRFIPDPTPIEVPLRLVQRQQSINDQIKAALRSQAIQQQQDARGEETIDDMLNFGEDEDDDGLPVSPHEIADMHALQLKDTFEKVNAAHRSAQRQRQKPLQADAERGGVRRDQERENVSGSSSGTSASAVRPEASGEAK